MKYIYFLPFFFALSFSAVFPQDMYQHKKDSLLGEIATSNGKAKLQAYESLGKLMFFQEDDATKILPFFDAWEKEVEKQGDMKMQRRIMYLSIGVLVNRRHYEDFLGRVDRVLSFSEQHGLYDEQYYAVHNSRLFALYELGRLSESLQESKELYEAAKKRRHPFGQSTALFRMGEIYSNLRRFNDAEKCYRECLELAHEELSSANTANHCYFGLIELMLDQKRNGEVSAALDEWRKLLQEIDQNEEEIDQDNWKRYYFMSTYAHAQMGNFDKAASYLQKADSIPSTYNGLENPSFRSHVRALVMESQGKYDEALKLIDECITDPNRMVAMSALEVKARILCKMGKGIEAYPLYQEVHQVRDSVQNMKFNAQLDEIHTQYEVDKHIAEKEKARNYMYFAVAGCILLVITLSIWIYYHRRIAKKNKFLAAQIKELQKQQEKAETELLNRISFIEEKNGEDDLCPERRKDQLCMAIRDILLKEKAYRDSMITRDGLINRLASNKNLFIDAFQNCFGMSFPEYINSLRLKDAIVLLERSDLPVEEVAEKVGFGTVRTFQRQFLAKYNMTPKEYRKACVKVNE